MVVDSKVLVSTECFLFALRNQVNGGLDRDIDLSNVGRNLKLDLVLLLLVELDILI